MANFLYKKFLQAQLTDVNAVDFDADTIKAGLFRSSDYSPNQNSDDYLADAGVPIRSAVVTCTVSGDVVDADAFTFAMVPAGALIDVMVLYKDSGDPATSTLIAKYDVSITPDGGDVSVTVPDGGLFTLGNISVLSIAQGGTGQVCGVWRRRWCGNTGNKKPPCGGWSLFFREE